MKNLKRIPPFVTFIIGLGLIAYLWNALGDRGMDADMNGTAGYTAPFEIMLGTLALILIVGSIIFILRRSR